MRTAARISIATLMPCAAAWADAPLLSETADVIDENRCQVELALDRSRGRHNPTLRSSEAVLSCAVHARTELALSAGRESGGGQTDRALGLGGKTTLVFPQPDRTGWGLSYGLDALRASGEGWRVDEWGALLVATREVAPGLLAHANLGTTRSRSLRQSTTTWSLGIETVANPTLAADVYGDDRSAPGVSAGIGYQVRAGWLLAAVLSRQFDSARTTTFTLAGRLEF